MTFFGFKSSIPVIPRPGDRGAQDLPIDIVDILDDPTPGVVEGRDNLLERTESCPVPGKDLETKPTPSKAT